MLTLLPMKWGSEIFLRCKEICELLKRFISSSIKSLSFSQLYACRNLFSNDFDSVTVWLWRIGNDCGKYLFRLCASFFLNFHVVKKYPLVFIADFGLRKVVLQAETFFGTVSLFREKMTKKWSSEMDFCLSSWIKVVSESYAYFLGYFSGNEKLLKNWK